jgi:hypothetical protein
VLEETLSSPLLAVKTRLVEISWELVDGFVFEMEISTSYPHDNRFLRCGKEIITAMK